MANCGVKKRFGFSPFRRRQQAASNRRFCITWINRMVNKQVEKRIAEQRSEFLLMIQALREEMMAELQEQLTELVAEEARERHLDLDQELRMTYQRQWKREEEYEEETEEDEEDETTSLDPQILSFTSDEIPCTSISIFTVRKLPKRELVESWYILLDGSSDGDPSDGEITEVFNDADTSSQPAKCEKQENISTDDATVADTSQLTEESEEEISKNPFLASPSFMTEQLRCEEERVQVDRASEEEASLMERQWNEWMDEQEMRVTHMKEKPVRPQNTENQGWAAPPVSEKQMTQNVKRVGTVKKIKTYLSDLFNRDTSYKWERLKEED